MSENGIKGLTVTFDSFDRAILAELKSHISYLLNHPWDLAHDYKETLKEVDGFMIVVSSYSVPKEFNDFKRAIKEDYDALVKLAYPPVEGPFDIKVLNFREMPDGSAVADFEASDKMKELLIGIGLNKLLEDHISQTVEDTPNVPGWEYFNE